MIITYKKNTRNWNLAPISAYHLKQIKVAVDKITAENPQKEFSTIEVLENIPNSIKTDATKRMTRRAFKELGIVCTATNTTSPGPNAKFKRTNVTTNTTVITTQTVNAPIITAKNPTSQFDFAGLTATLIHLIGGKQVSATTYDMHTKVRGGNPSNPLTNIVRRIDANGNKGLRIRSDIYHAATSAQYTNADAKRLLYVTTLIWNNPEEAKKQLIPIIHQDENF